jgi:hypothetical protein
MQSLAEFLGTVPVPAQAADDPVPDYEGLPAKAFADAVLNSKEFRQYVLNGLTLGELPAAIICRLMDYAWGKPVDRVEHTGQDGQPMAIKIVRVIVDATETDLDEPLDDAGSIH